MKPLTYATVCSGIECMSIAVRGLPLRPVFFSEVEPYPCAVLKYHYPNVPNLGDMTKIEINNEKKVITNGRTIIPIPDGGLDILAGGTPCQDFSVAGLRRGADGDNCDDGGTTRSSLCFNFIRLLRGLQPRYFIYENVPGMLTSNEGRDFAHFLVALGQSGYSDVSWRVLDAQYVRVDGMERAVPQRRRRVWVVGCLGSAMQRSAQILLEPGRMCGDSAPLRKTRKEIASYFMGGINLYDSLVGNVYAKVSHPRGKEGVGELGCNVDVASTRNTFEVGSRSQEVVYESPICCNFDLFDKADNCSISLCARRAKDTNVTMKQAFSIQGSMIGRSDKNGPQGCGYCENVSFTQNCIDQHGVCYKNEEVIGELLDKDISKMDYIVRRLMPVECERLMGLPDGYTTVHFTEDILTEELVDEFIKIKYNWDDMNSNGKTIKPKSRKAMRSWLLGISTNPPDSPRYKACGNGWATNQPRWIVMNILNTFHNGWDIS